MEYCCVKKKYLAFALSFLGFRYYKYDNPDGVSYSFEKTPEFDCALGELLNIKEKYDNYKK